MKITRNLNIVASVGEGDKTVHIHSTPVGRPIFEAHFKVLKKTLDQLYADGASPVMGMRVCVLTLKDEARKLNVLPSVESGLLPEIWRLTNCIVRGANGYETVPFEEVKKRSLISDDDTEEVENALCFFTAASHLHNKKEMEELILPIFKQEGWQTTSSNCTEYKTSLPTLISVVPTGPSTPPAASSLPI